MTALLALLRFTFLLAVQLPGWWLSSQPGAVVDACVLCTIDEHRHKCDAFNERNIGPRALKAPIVVVAWVREWYGVKEDDGYFRAEIEVLRILKGQQILDEIDSTNDLKTSDNTNETRQGQNRASRIRSPPRIYNTTKWGSPASCWSHLEMHRDYILFLQYDDEQKMLAANYTGEMMKDAATNRIDFEQTILDALGWRAWATWTPCSRTCAYGSQTRQRKCLNSDGVCNGVVEERRICNSFSCIGSVDLLQAVGLSGDTQLPVQGAERNERGSFNITKGTFLTVDLAHVIARGDPLFPHYFSLLVVFQMDRSSDAILFSLTDKLGQAYLALWTVGDHLQFYLNNGIRERTVQIHDLQLNDGLLHSLGVSVTESDLYIYLDCTYHLAQRFWSTERAHITKADLEIWIGSAPHNASRAMRMSKISDFEFSGVFEQFTLSPDPTTARKYCERWQGPSPTRRRSTPPPSTSWPLETEWPVPSEITTPTLSTASPIDPGDRIVFWSAWSQCTVTCGPALRSRFAYCRRSDGSDCELPNNSAAVPGGFVTCLNTPVNSEVLQHSLSSRQQRQCFDVAPCHGNPPCDPHCEASCAHGRCIAPGHCLCKHGYRGPKCDQVVCQLSCFNGGFCTKPNRCKCPPGYTGQLCERAVCGFPCLNGGRCVAPDTCACPDGFLPPNCSPICTVPCFNGGTCMGYNQCSCPPGFFGTLCQMPLCRKGCWNGGYCIAPDRCYCPVGYQGDQCEQPICAPTCKNNGTCLYPYFCSCQPGTYGSQCENFLCEPQCRNGGRCTGPGICQCSHGYTGRSCETAFCPQGCGPHGRCIAAAMCQCDRGWYGPRCLRSSARPQQLQVSVKNFHIPALAGPILRTDIPQLTTKAPQGVSETDERKRQKHDEFLRRMERIRANCPPDRLTVIRKKLKKPRKVLIYEVEKFQCREDDTKICSRKKPVMKMVKYRRKLRCNKDNKDQPTKSIVDEEKMQNDEATRPRKNDRGRTRLAYATFQNLTGLELRKEKSSKHHGQLNGQRQRRRSQHLKRRNKMKNL